MEQKENKILEILKEIRDFGLGKLIIDVREDEKYFVIAEKHTYNPTDRKVRDSLENAIAWPFRGVEQEEIGGKRLLREYKKYKI